MVHSTRLESVRPFGTCRFESCPLRQLEFFKLEEAASLRSAANLYSFWGENELAISQKI